LQWGYSSSEDDTDNLANEGMADFLPGKRRNGFKENYLAKLVDFGTVHNFDSLLITRHGKIVAEAYYAPYAAGLLHTTNPITKAVTGTLVGSLSQEGVLDNPSHHGPAEERGQVGARSSLATGSYDLIGDNSGRPADCHFIHQERGKGMRLIDDAERRTRLARRHALAPQHRVQDAEAAVRAMTVLHATEPATPYLSALARVDSFTRTDLEYALFESRTLVKQLAMRRTLFVFPRDLLPAALSAPSERVAQQDFDKLVKDLHSGGITDDGTAWLGAARRAVLRKLAGKREFSAKDLRESLSELSGKVSWYEHKPYGNVQHIAPRVLAWMGAT
jgi:hypothetical protein